MACMPAFPFFRRMLSHRNWIIGRVFPWLAGWLARTRYANRRTIHLLHGRSNGFERTRQSMSFVRI